MKLGEACLLLEVKADAITFNCHFFTLEEVEFDIDPREVLGEAGANTVFSFMRRLGEHLNKEVVLTPENAPELPIFRFCPETAQVEYLPPTL